jgi:hypothetical protein
VKWAYTVVYSGNVEADTEDEAKQSAVEHADLGFAETKDCDVEPIGETDAA